MIEVVKIKTFVKKQIKDVNIDGIQGLFRKLYLLMKISATILMDAIAVLPCLIIRL